MNVGLILVLVLLSVLATDVAVAVLFLTVRPHLRHASATAADASVVTAQLAALVSQVSARSEQAAVELERQRAELRRLLDSTPAAPPSRPRFQPGATLEFVALEAPTSIYAQARRAGISAEEVRIREALARRRASA